MAYTPGDQDTIEILVKARMDIKQFESSLLGLERKMQVAQKELSDSLSKIAYIEAKTSKVVSDATRTRLADLKSIEAVNRQSIATYKNQTAQIEKQIAFTKELSREQVKAQMHANAMGSTKTTQQPFKMGSESTSSINAAYAAMESGSKTSTTSTWLQRLLGQHDELDKKMKQVDTTAKNSFPHKVSTTAQYMAAGAGIMLVTSSLGSMITAIIESDKAVGMFQGVLEMTKGEAQGLQKEIFNIGTTFGGNLGDLNESALALGRAGLKSSELAGALKVVSQAALVSGDSLDAVTELLVSWKTVHPEESIQHIGDAMTKVGNASLASFDDFKTMTNYLLTSTASMGITADSAIALSGAWRNLGKGASTTGTEIRRFMDQISNGSDVVKKAYWSMGVNLDTVNKDLAKGGATAEAALVQVYKNIHDAMLDPNKKAAIAAASAKLQTLDKATFNSNIGLAKGIKQANGEIITSYESMVRVAKDSEGATAIAANKIALTYEKMWERIKTSLTIGSVEFEKGFTRALAGPDASVGDFKEKLKVFNEAFSSFMSSMGKVFGNAALILSKVIGYVDDLIVGYTIYKTLVVGTAVIEALNGVRLAIMGVLGMQTALNLATKANPWIALATVLGTAAYAMYEYATYTDDAAIATDKLNTSSSKLQFKVPSAEEQAKLDAYIASIDKANPTVAAPKVPVGTKRPTVYAGEFDDEAFYSKYMGKGATTNFSSKTLANTLGTKVEQEPTKSKTASALTPPGSGPKLEGKDTSSKINRDAMEAYRVAIGNAKVAEETYFVNSNTTLELAKQRYHVANTIPDMQKNLGLIKDKEIREIEANKLALDKQDTLNKIQATEKALNIEASTRMQTLQDQSKLAGNILDTEKIQLENTQQINIAKQKYYDDMNKGMNPDKALNIYKEELIYAQKVTDEKIRQLVIANRLRKESLDLTSLQIQASNATSGSEQIALEKRMLIKKTDNEILAINKKYKILDDKSGQQQEIDNAKALLDLELRKVEGAQSYFDLMRESNVQYQRQTTLAKGFFNVTQGAMGALQSGLTDYFQIGNEGYGKWSDLRDKLTKAILDGLMQELVIKQMIAMIGTATSSAPAWLGTAIDVGMAYFGGSTGNTSGGAVNTGGSSYTTATPTFDLTRKAKGGVLDNTNYLAKGGYVNSIVSQPTYVAKGTIAGEAGAEAVMPLQRDSQGRLGVNTTGGASGAQNIKVEIINNSSEELKVTKSEGKFDGEAFVLSVVIDAIKRNKGGMKDLVGGSR